MKKFIALLLALACLFGSAMSESPATPTDLIEIDDDDWGEITIRFEREVYIDEPLSSPYIGDIITLTAILVNFKEDDIVKFYWQYAIELPDWIFIDGENEQTYTFIVNKENYDYYYRVLVKLEEPELQLENYDTPLGLMVIINHAGDCFD